MGVLSGSAISGAAASPHASSTLSVAEPPGTTPSSLLPYYTGAQCYVINIDYWNLMYRPGYWFGLGNSITEQSALSQFNAPTITTTSGKTTASFTVKPWVWSSANSGGQTQVSDAQDVALWINMDQAESSLHGTSSTNSCGYTPGLGIPDDIQSVTYPGGLTGDSVVITFTRAFSNNFMLYNQLSQIQPMPVAWDETSGGGANAGACSSEGFNSVLQNGTDDCSNVFTFLSGLNLADPLWNWSDGPYRQSAFGYSSGSPNGINQQIANTLYSGPKAAGAVKTINYVPFLTENAEQAQLQSNKLDLGYLDPADITKSPGPGKAGKITLKNMTHYAAAGSVDFGVFYWNVNFGGSHSTDPESTKNVWVDELNQTYVRAAIQESINQAGVIAHIDNGYAVQDFSAVPKYPSNPFSAGVKNPYPFNTTKARALLEKNGFNSATPAVCVKVAKYGCGTKAYPVKKGSKLVFTLMQPTGDVAVLNQTAEEVATIKSAGIVIKEIRKAQNDVGSICFGGTATWELCNYGGWLFAPDYYPSGEVLFLPGAGSNDGGLNDPVMNGLIDATDFGSLKLNQKSPTYHTSYAEYSATSVPFIWQPCPAGFTIGINTLKGAQPPNPLGDFNPEYITAI
jgi:peptide/nickel transport system substrate-binding protein